MKSCNIAIQNVAVGDRMEAFITPTYGEQNCVRVFLPVVDVSVDRDGLIVVKLDNGHGIKHTVLHSPDVRVCVAFVQRQPALRLVANGG